MQNITLNIGLENNPLYTSQIKDLLQVLLGPLTEIDYKINIGQYQGKRERTMVINFGSSHSQSYLINTCKELCSALTQECIAIRCEDFAELVYNKDFTGEKYNFDPQYFIDF